MAVTYTYTDFPNRTQPRVSHNAHFNTYFSFGPDIDGFQSSGPFQLNGKLYVFGVDTSSGVINCLMSSNGGTTWTILDAGHEPTGVTAHVVDPGRFHYDDVDSWSNIDCDSVPGSGRVWVAFCSAGSLRLAYFDMSAELWGTTIYTGPTITPGGGNFANFPFFFIRVRPDGKVMLLTFNGPWSTPTSSVHTSIQVFDGSTFSSPVTLTDPAATSSYIKFHGMVVGGNNNTHVIHGIYRLSVGNPAAHIYDTIIDPSGAILTTDTVTTIATPDPTVGINYVEVYFGRGQVIGNKILLPITEYRPLYNNITTIGLIQIVPQIHAPGPPYLWPVDLIGFANIGIEPFLWYWDPSTSSWWSPPATGFYSPPPCPPFIGYRAAVYGEPPPDFTINYGNTQSGNGSVIHMFSRPSGGGSASWTDSIVRNSDSSKSSAQIAQADGAGNLGVFFEDSNDDIANYPPDAAGTSELSLARELPLGDFDRGMCWLQISGLPANALVALWIYVGQTVSSLAVVDGESTTNASPRQSFFYSVYDNSSSTWGPPVYTDGPALSSIDTGALRFCPVPWLVQQASANPSIVWRKPRRPIGCYLSQLQ